MSVLVPGAWLILTASVTVWFGMEFRASMTDLAYLAATKLNGAAAVAVNHSLSIAMLGTVAGLLLFLTGAVSIVSSHPPGAAQVFLELIGLFGGVAAVNGIGLEMHRFRGRVIALEVERKGAEEP